MIPPFHSAVDQAITYLDPARGLVGVTDFYVSAKFDLPLRQMTWARRFFWRCAGCSTAAAAAAMLRFATAYLPDVGMPYQILDAA